MAPVGRQKPKLEPVRSWVALAAALVTFIVGSGVRRSMGLLFLEMMDLCDAQRSTTSFMVSLFFICSLGASPIVAPLTKRFGARVMVFSGGILASVSVFSASFSRNIVVMIVLLGAVNGLGHCCLFIPCVSTVSHHFDRRRSRALALCFCGCSIGAFVVPPILSAAAERYAAPGMLIILSGISLQILLAAVLLFPPEEGSRETELPLMPVHSQPQDMVSEECVNEPGSLMDHQVLQPCVNRCATDQSTGTSLIVASRKRSVLRSMKFHEVNFSVGLANITLGLSFFLIPPLAEDANISRFLQSIILLLMGFSDIIGRILCGYFSDRFPSYRSYFFLGVNVLQILTWLSPIFNLSFASVLVFSLFHNLFAAFLMTLAVPIIIDILGLENVEISIAYGTCVDAILFVIFPPLSTFVRESTGTWQSACAIVAAFMTLSVVIFSRHLIFAFYRKKRRGVAEDTPIS